MKLLIYSHYFAPSIGGVENMTRKLATGLVAEPTRGINPEFEVVVVTRSAAGAFDDSTLPFRVVRRPGVFKLAQLIRDCEVLHIAGPSLLPLFLARLLRKSTIVEQHGYQAICPNGSLLQLPDGNVCPGHFQARHYRTCFGCQRIQFPFLHSLTTLVLTGLRGKLCESVINTSISRHVANRLSPDIRCQVIYYGIEDICSETDPRSPTFVQSSKICFAYVGRLVSEKGVSLLLDAARQLAGEGLSFDLFIIGDGPERENLQAQILRDALGAFTRITGFLQGSALNRLMERVHVVVMP